MTVSHFAVTWDYRCPFARNAHEHLLTALDAGAGWDVTFVPFSLSQVHVAEGGTPVWDDPARDRDLLAMEAAIAVRERWPESFAGLHAALFAARHDHSRDLRYQTVVREVLAQTGLDPDAVMAEVGDGWPKESFRKEHELSVQSHGVWGVPTFIVDDRAAFVRIMTRPRGDAEVARRTIDRILLALGDWPEINELKHTTLNH
ncbi:MAG TPA: DsbA family protein [Acidimicrobiales bacterium]|nr:DsbA family protein [Acidimicrobiales bacterium]